MTTKRGVVAWRSACVALALFLAAFGLEAKANAAARSERKNDEAMNAQARGRRDGHLTIDASIRDLLSHAAFVGFGHLILPWDDRAYDASMRLSNISSLLPYHSHVNPGDVVSALNHMIDDANAARPSSSSFYTGAQKRAEPRTRDRGCSSSGVARRTVRHRLPGRAGSPMSAPSTKAFPTPWRSAGRATMPSSCDTGRVRAARSPPRTWLPPSRTSSGVRHARGQHRRLFGVG